MNTRQIERFLRRHPKTSSVFLKCVPVDGIPASDTYPYAVVVNTDGWKLPGRHWVAIYVVAEGVV